MRRVKVVLCAVAVVSAWAGASGSTAVAADAPSSGAGGGSVASFQAMLDGMGKRDKAAMVATFLPGGTATLMRKDKPVQLTLEALADKIAQSGTEL